MTAAKQEALPEVMVHLSSGGWHDWRSTRRTRRGLFRELAEMLRDGQIRAFRFVLVNSEVSDPKEAKELEQAEVEHRRSASPRDLAQQELGLAKRALLQSLPSWTDPFTDAMDIVEGRGDESLPEGLAARTAALAAASYALSAAGAANAARQWWPHVADFQPETLRRDAARAIAFLVAAYVRSDDSTEAAP